MPKELQQVADAIGSIFNSPLVQFGIRAAVVYVVVLWLAASYWAFRDMQLRTDNPILPYVAAAGIILLTPFFFPFAIVVYRIVRPQERMGEVYERNLAEEALLNEVESVRHCPGCNRRIHEDWLICPTCRTRLNRVCPNCGKLVGLDWSLCAWCGRDFERRDIAAAATLEPLPGGRQALEPGTGADASRASIRSATREPARRAAAHGSTDPLPEH
jgi:RNA polymerase subunit RPABC4/transcription elongation factor Spt4